jgi:hypothetical protein
MRAQFWPSVAIACFMVAGCDSGLYSATPSKEGSVIVINRLTGTVQRVDGEKLIELRESHELPTTEYKPSLSTATISRQPILIDANVKYRDGMMVLLHIRPDTTIKSDAAWEAWRNHLNQVRSSGSLNLQFMDRDGFLVVAHDLSLTELTRIVDFKGEPISFQTQVTIPITRDAYTEITSWQVGWAGWWPYSPPASDDHSAKKGT